MITKKDNYSISHKLGLTDALEYKPYINANLEDDDLHDAYYEGFKMGLIERENSKN